MIGGEQPLTAALLHDWAKEGFEQRFTAWVESLGGKLLPFRPIVEEIQVALREGRDIFPLLRGEEVPQQSYRWDDIANPNPVVPSHTNPRWVWFCKPTAPMENVLLTGPKGGNRGQFVLGWHYSTPYNNLPPGAWFEPTTQEGIGGFQNTSYRNHNEAGYYAWLWGHSHVAVLHCSLSSMAAAIRTEELFANIFASMFNNMLTRMELAPTTAEKAPPKPKPLPDFSRKLAAQMVQMADRIKNRREEIQARLASAESTIKAYQDECEGYKRTLSVEKQAPDLRESLQAILDKGLCSVIKQDTRGLWFLFDDIHAVVSAALAAKGTRVTGVPIIPGIYKLEPAVVYLPWGARGNQWACGTLTGTSHPHPHAGSGGAFGRPCLGATTGAMGPPGIDNAGWFAQLWDEDPVKWAEAIHAFMRQTGFEQNAAHYRGVWTFGTLVTSHEAKFKVTRRPTPKLTVSRLSAANAEEGA